MPVDEADDMQSEEARAQYTRSHDNRLIQVVVNSRGFAPFQFDGVLSRKSIELEVAWDEQFALCLKLPFSIDRWRRFVPRWHVPGYFGLTPPNRTTEVTCHVSLRVGARCSSDKRADRERVDLARSV